MQTYTDEDVEQLHQTVDEYKRLLVSILAVCQHEADGYWKVPTLGGGKVYSAEMLSKALDKALRAIVLNEQ